MLRYFILAAHAKMCIRAYADSEDPGKPVQSNQGLCFLLTKSLDTTDCINGESMDAWMELCACVG